MSSTPEQVVKNDSILVISVTLFFSSENGGVDYFSDPDYTRKPLRIQKQLLVTVNWFSMIYLMDKLYKHHLCMVYFINQNIWNKRKLTVQ